MANIHDYLLWRGDIPMHAKFKFNELDSMVLARFSYLPFEKINIRQKETISSIAKKMENFANEEFMYNGDKELITYLGQSERFKNMCVTDYIQNNDKETEEQFRALTVHISDKEIYISYMGTDYTIYAWKEDFNMAFMENVPCQIAGKKYLEEISKKYPHQKMRIGGHSKGGNVAIYAAVTAPKRIQNKILKVYNYDGPGFNEHIIDKYKNDEIIGRIETYIPQDSVVGRLLNHKEKMTVTLSHERGILQHDIFSWQVMKDDLIRLEKNTQTSENIDKALTTWIETTTGEQRKIFVDAVFELLYSTDADTFVEMSKNVTANISKILRKYTQLSADDRKVMTRMIKIIVTSYVSSMRESEKIKGDRRYFGLFRRKEEESV